jgi:hypothetical protein
MHMHYWTLAMVPLFMIWIPWVIERLGWRSARGALSVVV